MTTTMGCDKEKVWNRILNYHSEFLTWNSGLKLELWKVSESCNTYRNVNSDVCVIVNKSNLLKIENCTVLKINMIVHIWNSVLLSLAIRVTIKLNASCALKYWKMSD